MTEQFYSPVATHNPLRFFLPVEQKICVGPAESRFLMGGIGLASAVDAIERATDRPLIWATAQYLSYVPPGAVMDIDVRAPVMGKTTSQARAVAHVGEKEILTVNAALGTKPDQPSVQHAHMPDVTGPDASEPIEHDHVDGDDLSMHWDARAVIDPENAARGIARKWMRSVDGVPVSSGLLAIVGDYVLGAVGPAMGRETRCNSLDNTLRVHTTKASDWLLCDIHITGVAQGFCHGSMNIFAEDGTLLAVASQSGTVRLLD